MFYLGQRWRPWVILPQTLLAASERCPSLLDPLETADTHINNNLFQSNTPNRCLQTVRCCDDTTMFRTPTCRAEQSIVAQCLLGSLCLETMKDEKRTKDTVN